MKSSLRGSWHLSLPFVLKEKTEIVETWTEFFIWPSHCLPELKTFLCLLLYADTTRSVKVMQISSYIYIHYQLISRLLSLLMLIYKTSENSAKWPSQFPKAVTTVIGWMHLLQSSILSSWWRPISVCKTILQTNFELPAYIDSVNYVRVFVVYKFVHCSDWARNSDGEVHHIERTVVPK